MYVSITNRIPTETWEKVRKAMATLPIPDLDSRKKLSEGEAKFLRGLRQQAIAVDGPDDQVRMYPHGALAAHVLGFVGRNGAGKFYLFCHGIALRATINEPDIRGPAPRKFVQSTPVAKPYNQNVIELLNQPR